MPDAKRRARLRVGERLTTQKQSVGGSATNWAAVGGGRDGSRDDEEAKVLSVIEDVILPRLGPLLALAIPSEAYVLPGNYTMGVKFHAPANRHLLSLT